MGNSTQNLAITLIIFTLIIGFIRGNFASWIGAGIGIVILFFIINKRTDDSDRDQYTE